MLVLFSIENNQFLVLFIAVNWVICRTSGSESDFFIFLVKYIHNIIRGDIALPQRLILLLEIYYIYDFLCGSEEAAV